jgi:hypothetical protein
MPTLFDVLAIELVNPRSPYELSALRIEVAADGLTKPVPDGKPNARVALEVDIAAFMKNFVDALD